MDATVDRLPALDDARRVDPSTVEAFARDGHALVRGLCSTDEIAAYREVIEHAALTHSRETRPIHERDTYGKAFLQIWNLWRVDPAVARFTLAHRFASVAAQLLGVPAVRLYHDQALFKEPGGGPTPWHQDQYYWPIRSPSVDVCSVTMWMPLRDVAPEVGTMTFADGTHLLGDLGRFGISDESEAVFQQAVDDRGLRLRTHGAIAAGDATFHAGWTLHRAPGNPTDRMRSVMTVIYLAADCVATEPQHDAQRKDLATWLPGVRPGEPCASDLNPLL